MHAVIGTWDMDPERKQMQDEALPGLIAGISSRPGFVHAYWTSDVTEPRTNISFVAWETREQAEEFRAGVEANREQQLAAGVDNRGLRVVQVDGHA